MDISPRPKKLIYYACTDIEEMLRKGNVWYVRNYESYFNEVYIVYLSGKNPKIVTQGRTKLVSLGRNGKRFNLLLAPFRLLKFAYKIRPTHYLTADIIFSGWTSILIKPILKAKVILMPVCMPENIYQNSNQTLSGLPRAIERIMLGLSFLSANKVLTGYGFGNFVCWLSENIWSKNKLVIVNKIVEALPTPEFFKALRDQEQRSVKKINNNRASLLYVGRLSKDKMVDDLLKALRLIIKMRPTNEFYLTIIGEGSEKDNLLKLATALNIDKKIKFVNYLKNEELVSYYFAADVYLSPFTGESLREAALCGIPIVAYDMDWVKNILRHKENALLVSPRDVNSLALEVVRLLEDHSLRIKLARNVKKLAWELWGDSEVKYSLGEAFDKS